MVGEPGARETRGGYENDRLNECEVARTITGGHDASVSDTGTSVVHTQGLDGYNKTLTGDCAPTISGAACDLHHTHGVISTNSNGEDVAPTISSCEYKMGQKQKDTGGGYVLTRREEGAHDEPQL